MEGGEGEGEREQTEGRRKERQTGEEAYLLACRQQFLFKSRSRVHMAEGGGVEACSSSGCASQRGQQFIP